MNEHVDKLIKMLQVAKSHNSKEIRMPTVDAEQLCLSLVSLLNSNNENLKKILILQDRLLAVQQQQQAPSMPSTSVGSFNGGSF